MIAERRYLRLLQTGPLGRGPTAGVVDSPVLGRPASRREWRDTSKVSHGETPARS